MPTLKTEDRQFTSNPSQQPSSSRRKRSSQASFEFSSSEECLVVEKERENERKWRNEEATAKLPSTVYCQREVIDRFVQTKAYICSELREITKKKLKLKAIKRTKWEETKNCNKNNKSVKCRRTGAA